MAGRRNRDRLRFEQRALDDNNDRLGDWATIFTCSAVLTFLRGGEGVLAQRLQGTLPVILVVRKASELTGLDNSWRAVDVHDETRVFDITGATPAKELGFVDVLAVQRVGQTVG